AVIVADLFDEKFRPITFSKPSAFLPVVDRLAIEYTLEMLIESGFRHILIVISRHIDRVRTFVRSSKYFTQKMANLELLVVNPHSCVTIGDAMREIYRDPRSHLRGEFIVISGFAVCKPGIRALVDRHIQRRINDDRVILTALFNRYSASCPIKDTKRDVFIVAERKSNEILYINGHDHTSYLLKKGPIFNKQHMDVMFDLNYSGIYFFDNRALQLFTDNFDFQTVDDLINNVLGDDIIQKAICYDIVNDEYIGPMSSLNMYYMVSFDVLERWSHPFTPDKKGYTQHFDQVYFNENVEVDRSADLRGGIALGRNTFIGQNVVLDHTIIGDNCCIGSNTTITNSYIWSNVKIENDCTIENAIICDDVVVLHHTELIKGCILSFGVTVGPRAVIPQLTIVHIPQSNYEAIGPCSIVDLGLESNGTIYTVYESEIENYKWGFSYIRKFNDENLEKKLEKSESEDLDDDCDFSGTIHETVIDGISDNVPVETIITEVNVAKHTFNVSIETVTLTVCDAIAELCLPKILSLDEEIISSIIKQSEIMAPFCKRFFKTFALLTSLIIRLEESLHQHTNPGKLYIRLILHLYGNDIIDIEFLNKWHDDMSDDVIPIQKVLDILKAAHIESSDSESSDEE
ncbi:hypothetical protein MXB_1483, partial [Myxobolus squamalis]